MDGWMNDSVWFRQLFTDCSICQLVLVAFSNVNVVM